MGIIKNFMPVKLFFAVTYNNINNCDFIKILEDKYGKIDTISDEYVFSDYTNYYNREMGEKLKKQIVTIQDTISINDLHKVKLFTNQIEDKYSIDSKRNINIDPGYLTEAKLVLFSTKNNIHRIYINNGIFAEITLKYVSKQKTYMTFDYTYPDYKSHKLIEFFNSVRDNYKIDSKYKKWKSEKNLL